MPKVSTRQAQQEIKNLASFTSHGALRGESDPEFSSVYTLWSYNTVIAEAYVDDARKYALMDNSKYSVTTSRHQNIIKRGLLDAGFELLYYYNYDQKKDIQKQYDLKNEKVEKWRENLIREMASK